MSDPKTVARAFFTEADGAELPWGVCHTGSMAHFPGLSAWSSGLVLTGSSKKRRSTATPPRCCASSTCWPSRSGTHLAATAPPRPRADL
jgi:hypothetical protein